MNFEGFSVPVKTKFENFTERVRVGMDDEVPGAIRVYTVRRERRICGDKQRSCQIHGAEMDKNT